MTLQTNSSVAVARAFPIHLEDSSSNSVNLILLNNILSPEYNRTTHSFNIGKYQICDNTILYVNSDEKNLNEVEVELETKKSLFKLSSKNLRAFLEEEKKYGSIF